ncbi:MAG: alanine--tRNA ligase, partial [Mycoplasmatales bacterium]
MKKLSTNEIRQIWIDFFYEKGHHIEPSKSLVPVNDNSLLFINSGVATLKKYFDGSELPPKNRIANAQKSIRTNDIENVGVTSRHHTLFEMLGNFSIGDYFKEESIEWGYEILTNPKWFGFDPKRLYYTIHSNDDFAYECWVNLGVDPKKIIRLEENFWEIGPGPGGPNTEIFYDRGEKYDDRDPVLLIQEDLENNRVIEIWNIVFSQYNCNPGVVPICEYPELPQKNIDTGMGLERMACVIQDVETNFETDNFMVIINALVAKTSIKYSDKKMAYRVISDHIRALTFAIADGALPSNEGRGYVLRRILRRAIRFGYHDLGLTTPFLYDLVDAVNQVSSDFYPYLLETTDFVKKVIMGEEEKFFNTITDGISLLEKEINVITNNKLEGSVAFKLYDTYGFPIELTVEIAHEKG